MDCSTPGLTVHHQLPEFTQTHVHSVGDAIQPSHPLSSPFPPVVPFSSHLQSFPASGSFQMSQFFVSGGQSIGVSASTSVLPMNIQDRFPLGWTGWISLQSKGLSRVFSKTTVQKYQFFLNLTLVRTRLLTNWAVGSEWIISVSYHLMISKNVFTYSHPVEKAGHVLFLCLFNIFENSL